jgi:NAD(P)H-hydrate epimerase
MKIVTAEQMAALDRRTIEELGVAGVVLMEVAGRAVVEAMESRFCGVGGRSVLVLCGKGNNGGDGFVVARHLLSRGADVVSCLLGRVADLRVDALINARILERLGGVIEELPGEGDLARLDERLARAEVIVDALFGTGLRRPAGGRLAGAIERMNRAGKPVVAVDIPSGLFADSGVIPGPAIRAELTVTFGLPKLVHYTYPAAACCGEVVVADIGIPARFVEEAGIGTELLTAGCLARLRAPRAADAHKGRFGHLLIVAGSPGKTGAAALAGEAAVRLGAGLVTVAVPRSLNAVLEVKLTEAMSLPLPETARGGLAEEAYEAIVEFLQRASALALGPGLGGDPETVALVRRLVAERTRPTVVDADGLNALAGDLGPLRGPADAPPLVLTPHPGEMSRLTGKPTATIQADRLACARELATAHGVHVVLKGAGTIVAEPDGRVFLNPTGNASLASGGTGDVLTGMIGALLAQGFPPGEAACAAVYLHGAAADVLVRERPEWHVAAGDLIRAFPAALEACS